MLIFGTLSCLVSLGYCLNYIKCIFSLGQELTAVWSQLLEEARKASTIAASNPWEENI